MVTDPIADMLIQLKNAGQAKKLSVTLVHSNLKLAIAKLLKEEGYLHNVSRRGKKVKKTITMDLSYDEAGKSKINVVKRVSKSSRRIYKGFSELRPIRQGKGISVISTPKGVLTDYQARKEKVGGEVLFTLW